MREIIRIAGILSAAVLMFKLAAVLGMPVYDPSTEHLVLSAFGILLWAESEWSWRRR